ncbi:MAG: 23S rRNA (guanosine(2251)-2'-O)-methyltransferase RlmB [Acidobacteriaceae bacterium]
MEVLYGLHPVEEAVRSGARRLDCVLLARERGDARLERLAQLCRDAGVRVTLESRDQLTRMARTDAHQGVLALVHERAFLTIEDLLAPAPVTNIPARSNQEAQPPHRFFLALDGIEDPHNLGALLRTADGAGVDGVILPERRSAPVSSTVAKTSAGASEHVRIARVTNLVRALEQMKQTKVWVLGLDERGSPDYTSFDFCTDCVLVLGREGEGLHNLVKKTCDHLLRIPMAGAVSSLNVSVAGAIVMYEALRQRSHPVQPAPKPAAPPKPRKGLGS